MMTAPTVVARRLNERVNSFSTSEDFHMPAATLDLILDTLDFARQRATYGAVAAVVGASPRALMAGRERNERHSWVVNLRSGLPTDYAAELMHVELLSNPAIIKTQHDLVSWLASRDVHVSDAPAAAVAA